MDEGYLETMKRVLVTEPEFLYGLKQKCWNECVKKVKGRYAGSMIGETKCAKRCMDKVIRAHKIVRDIYSKEFEGISQDDKKEQGDEL